VPDRNIARLAALPFVQRLSADAAVKKNDEFTVEHTGANIALQQYKLTGKGVTVAVVDSGVHKAKDLSDDKATGLSGLLDSVSFLPDGRDDKCGHGTHVAGIIAGNGKCSRGKYFYRTFYGVARLAGIVSVRVLDETGSGNVSDVIAGIQWVIATRDRYHTRVLNLSLGHPVGESYTTDPLCQAVERAWKSGIVVVCAAGNQGR
jgi:serine protease AprX